MFSLGVFYAWFYFLGRVSRAREAGMKAEGLDRYGLMSLPSISAFLFHTHDVFACWLLYPFCSCAVLPIKHRLSSPRYHCFSLPYHSQPFLHTTSIPTSGSIRCPFLLLPPPFLSPSPTAKLHSFTLPVENNLLTTNPSTRFPSKP